MSRYRKKPVVVEAFQMTHQRRRDKREWPRWLRKAWDQPYGPGSLWPMGDSTDRLGILTLEGWHEVTWDDWIIQGVAGELYPCKDAIFKATYDPVVGS